MTFGLRNAPGSFQLTLDLIRSGVRFKTCLVYHGAPIFSKSFEDHIKHLDEVLQLLQACSISLKLRKCSFFREAVDYRGHILLHGRLAASKDSTSEIPGVVFPREKTQLRSFLGSCNVFRRFIEVFIVEQST